MRSCRVSCRASPTAPAWRKPAPGARLSTWSGCSSRWFRDLLSGRLGEGGEERLADDAFDALIEVLLGDDPEAAIQALVDGIAGGHRASPSCRWPSATRPPCG